MVAIARGILNSILCLLQAPAPVPIVPTLPCIGYVCTVEESFDGEVCFHIVVLLPSSSSWASKPLGQERARLRPGRRILSSRLLEVPNVREYLTNLSCNK